VTGRHRTWNGKASEDVSVPVYRGENVMVPVIRAIVRPASDPSRVLLQRRDDPAESVRGSLEIPGGQWRAGESPIDAITREVREEAGLDVTHVLGIAIDTFDERRPIASIEPLVVISGVHGAFPAIHTVLVVDGEGEPRARHGESRDVRWWMLSEVIAEMASNRAGFIPSSYGALRAYEAWLGSTGDWMASS